jgi:hypothetical protein
MGLMVRDRPKNIILNGLWLSCWRLVTSMKSVSYMDHARAYAKILIPKVFNERPSIFLRTGTREWIFRGSASSYVWSDSQVMRSLY